MCLAAGLSAGCAYGENATYTPVVSLMTDSAAVLNQSDDESFIHRALLDIGVEAQWSQSWQGFANVQLHRGEDEKNIAGDIQGYSNIDAQNYSRLAEYWLQYSQGDWRFKLGQVDINGEFAYVDHGGEFISNSMGYTPTLIALPTFPEAAWGAMAFYQLGDSLQGGFAISAGQGQHDFDELHYITNVRSTVVQGTLELGWWYHTGEFSHLGSNQPKEGTGGWFATYNADWNANTGYFLQYGKSDKRVAEIYRHLGGGIHFRQPWQRPDDSFGIGVTAAWLSPHLGAPETTEIVIEGFYQWQVNEHFSIKPDIQWIQNPSGQNVSTDPLVFTLRLALAF